MTEETLEPVETETDPEERIRELTAKTVGSGSRSNE